MTNCWVIVEAPCSVWPARILAQAARAIAGEVPSWLPPGAEAERLARDAPLLRVAGKARALRLDKARRALGLPPLDAPPHSK